MSGLKFSRFPALMQSLNLPVPEAAKGEHHAMKEFEKEWNRDSVKRKLLLEPLQRNVQEISFRE